MLKSIIRGSDNRRTRLHNCRGQLLDRGGFRYLADSVITTVRFKLTGHRPDLPWLGYRAIRRLDGLIGVGWRVLEFGSGTSTVWFARRCAFVLSLETDERWHGIVRELLDRARLDNVDLRLCPRKEDGRPDYRVALSDRRGDAFDLVVVDGAGRDLATEAALELVKDGGYVFVDNTDLPSEEFRAADRLLRLAAEEGAIEVFNDVCPTVVMVNEGTLARIPAREPRAV